MDVVELWRRLEQWAAANAPCMLEDLNPGASEEQIKALERHLGRALPPDLRQSLQLHNGEKAGWPCTIFADFGDYLSLAEIQERRQMYLQVAERWGNEADMADAEELIADGIIFVEGPVKPVMYSPDWIPVMDFNADVFWALDFEPAQGGADGQLIEVDWEATSWRVVARSFADFLAGYVQNLEAGEYRLVDGVPTRRAT